MSNIEKIKNAMDIIDIAREQIIILELSREPRPHLTSSNEIIQLLKDAKKDLETIVSQ